MLFLSGQDLLLSWAENLESCIRAKADTDLSIFSSDPEAPRFKNQSCIERGMYCMYTCILCFLKYICHHVYIQT